MLVRPITSLRVNNYDNFKIPGCGAKDFKDDDTVCGATSVGHMWPSDLETLRHIKEVKDGRGQAFPYASTGNFCRRHQLIYSAALDNLATFVEVGNGSR